MRGGMILDDEGTSVVTEVDNSLKEVNKEINV